MTHALQHCVTLNLCTKCYFLLYLSTKSTTTITTSITFNFNDYFSGYIS